MRLSVSKIYQMYAHQAGSGAMKERSFYKHNNMGQKLMCLAAAGE